MRMRCVRFGGLCLSLLLNASSLSLLAADTTGRPQLYDTAANGNQQISQALKTANPEGKRIILKFGANWAGWCHRLSGLLKTNAELARIVEESYLIVLIDVDKGHNANVVKR